MALKVLAAFRSCFFSVLFLVFFLDTAVVTAKAVDAKEGVDFWFSADLINCLGTNLVSKGKELMSSTLLRLSAVKITMKYWVYDYSRATIFLLPQLGSSVRPITLP